MGRVVRSILGAALVLGASVSFAGKHPVPLDKNTDSAKCIECHEDKAKGKVVHSAIAMGCTTCHEIRVTKEATRIKLTTTTTSALCLSCHADHDAAKLTGKVHAPAVRDCVKCHSPHTADNKNNLLKAVSGDSGKDNLCLGCHNVGVDVGKNGSRHAALDSGCDTCHVTHKTGQRGKREFDFHLTKDAPALCIDCHDVKDADLKKAHKNQPFETADCLSCHDPHASSAPKLMQVFQHNPFESKTCEVCHQDAKDGKVVLTQGSARELCLTCHSDKSDQIEKAAVQHPGAAGDCTDCHNPHAANQPGLPKTNPVEICLACHSDQADQGKKAHAHQPAFVQGCATCHEPHGGQNTHLLRKAGVNDLCLECHGPEFKAQRLPAENAFTIFDGKVKLPAAYFSQIAIIDVNKYNQGHPVPKHPVMSLPDPSDPKSVPMNCLTCHQPHASTQRGLLIKDQANNMAFCQSCHKDLTQH